MTGSPGRRGCRLGLLASLLCVSVAMGGCARPDGPPGSATVLDSEIHGNAQGTPRHPAPIPDHHSRIAPVKDFSILTAQHTSLQFSDSEEQMTSDVDKIFKRGKQILSGTEASDNPLTALLHAAAKKYGYRLFKPRGEWLAVKRSLAGADSLWRTGFIPVIESFEGEGKHSDRGVSWASFTVPDLGRITMGVSHYLTHGRKPGDPNFALNRRLAQAIGAWAGDKGKGTALVFYSGDQNKVDRLDDTFLGAPLTSAWDELKRYENTGHGNLDVIASYDGDGRIRAKAIRALDDTEFPLYTDHFLVEATYKVRNLQ